MGGTSDSMQCPKGSLNNNRLPIWPIRESARLRGWAACRLTKAVAETPSCRAVIVRRCGECNLDVLLWAEVGREGGMGARWAARQTPEKSPRKIIAFQRVNQPGCAGGQGDHPPRLLPKRRPVELWPCAGVESATWMHSYGRREGGGEDERDWGGTLDSRR